MSTIVGIDLGTTNSLVAYIRGDRPEIIPNEQGRRVTPSVVGLDKRGRLHVGETAKNQLVAMPDRTVAAVKRLMGTSQTVRLGERTYTPQEISALILKKLKEDAERHLGRIVHEAVITVPAYFTDAQRQATKDAGELAGFKVERILNEPTAAALAYGLDNLDKEQYVLVYDLGGGTFDVSVLEMFEGVLDVKASAGNNRLGGEDFDRRIVEHLMRLFEREHGISLAGDLKAMARLKAAAEQAKCELSSVDSTTILLPFLAFSGGTPLGMETELSREQLELLIEDLVRSTLEPIDIALRDARLTPAQIHEVILVGGSSRIPLVQRMLAEKFGKEPRRDVNPDEAIALGAAIQAGLKSGSLDISRGIMITDVCPFTLGVEVVGNTGFQKMSGMFSPIIPRNSTIPISRTEIYSTTTDGQQVVDIKVYQGESRLVKNNVFLGAYSVHGVPPGPAGAEKISITFTYDINGILNVKTRILSTNKEETLRIERSSQRLTDEERQQARLRLQAEWGAGAQDDLQSRPAESVPGALPAPAVADPPTAAPSAPVPPASPVQPSPAAKPSASVKALVAAAEKKAREVDPQSRARIEQLVREIKQAVALGERTEAARLEEALTNLLFELE
ncbi:MAG: Hsp70 family protein [Myxococcota bacterium]|nr:Hsp70 family protein [Myxococcota bacterium]